MRVLVASSSMKRAVPELKKMVSRDCEFIVPESMSDSVLVELARDVEIIICVRLSAEVVRAAKRLRLIQKTGAGVDAIPFDSFEERNIHVANTSGSNSVPVAEHAFALLLALAKRVVRRHNKFQAGIADREASIELRGKTLGVLGMGSIGREVVKRGLSFSMRVVATKRNPSKELERSMNLDFLGGPVDLERILRLSDFVVITLPLTPETRGLLGGERVEDYEEFGLSHQRGQSGYCR